MGAASASSNFNGGFPTPGPQTPTGQDVMNHVFFASKTGWKQIREQEQFDYIVIGSGFCALAFIDQVYRNAPHARVLVLERGPFFLPEHFQNLPLPYAGVLGGLSETFPWTLSMRTHEAPYIKWQHGMVPFFGGRSILWSAWCPRPTPEEMQGWPEEVIAAAHAYFPEAERLLNVIPASAIDRRRSPDDGNPRPIYGELQQRITALLESGLGKVSSLTRTLPAPLAAGAAELSNVDFAKFSTPGQLLMLADRQAQLAAAGQGAPLRIATECIVGRILQQGSRPTALETSRGIVNVGGAKVVLAMGALPPTTLVLNSFPQVANAGGRFTAHFITSVVARVPRADYDFDARLLELELAANYVAGIDRETQGQYHIQLTSLSDRDPQKNAAAAQRHMPDVVATASMEQLLTSKDHLVFVCAVLGELDWRNPDSWLRRDDGEDPTTNVTLQVLANANDDALWNTMDQGTFETLERILSPKGPARVEYWHADGGWKPARPPLSQIRVPGLVHEGSTLWIGQGQDAVVGLDYALKGVDDVYVTGAALWPASGSWNPTLTMVALAQHLGDLLSKPA